MPQKIENFVIDGLPAKIFLHCYLEPQTGYSLSKRIHGKGFGNKSSSKIYAWLQEMQENGYLVQDEENKLIADDDKVIAQIRKELSKKFAELDDADFAVISAILKSSSFKELARKMYGNAILKEGTAADLICNILSAYASVALLTRNETKLTAEDKKTLANSFDLHCRRISQKSYHRYLEKNNIVDAVTSHSEYALAKFVIPGLSSRSIKQLSELSSAGLCLSRVLL